MKHNANKQLLTLLIAALVFLLGFQAAGQTLDPLTIQKYACDMPVIRDLGLRIDMTAGGNLGNVTMAPSAQNLLGKDINGVDFPFTNIWGYGFTDQGLPVTYPGATIVAMRDNAINVRWNNDLVDGGGNPLSHLLPVDPSLHIAVNDIPSWNPLTNSPVPLVTHLHGGHTESASDGLPEAWFTPGFADMGASFVKKDYHYDNDQEAATLWYHDHALGITRINVYAGLAGFYLLRDDNENQLIANNVLPSGAQEIEIVVQDRMFTQSGQLFYPSDVAIEVPALPFPGGPSINAEFFGDIILVNGKAWPKLDVEPRKYRLRLLNGSDSRFYVLQFGGSDLGVGGHPFMQIGTDNGLLEQPVQLTSLLIAPGERADVVVDFAGMAGQDLILKNFGPDDPFKGFDNLGNVIGGSADPATTGQIMKFDIDGSSPVNDATVALGTTLRNPILPLVQSGSTRNLALFEGLDEFGRLQPLLGVAGPTADVDGNIVNGTLAWFQPITENPMLNDVEIWEVYNATEDAHPIHLHLVTFQIINRESFTSTVVDRPQLQHGGTFGTGAELSNIVLGGDVRGPEPNEEGWKDTAVMLPGEVTRVIARFDRLGRYVWHCHILSHEDHEMMRPYHVGPLVDNVNPVCQITGINPGPPLNVDLQFQDNESGLARVEAVTLENAQVEVPVGSGNYLTAAGDVAFLGNQVNVFANAAKVDNSTSATVVLRVVDALGNSILCDPVYTTLDSSVPLSFDLKQNYPNPFNPATTIHYDVASSFEGLTPVKLTIFDVLGRTVKTLVDEKMEPGKYSVQWDGSNANGQLVSGGVYFYRMTAGHFTSTRKMVFMK